MKGVLVNPLSGITPGGVGLIRLAVTPEEWGFWMWRVQGISVSISGNLSGSTKNPPDNHVHTGSATIAGGSNGYTFGPTGLIQKEKEQAISRRAFSSVSRPLLGYFYMEDSSGPFNPTGDNEGWIMSVDFCGQGGLDPLGWWIGLDVSGSVTFQDYHEDAGIPGGAGAGASFSTQASLEDPYSGSGSVHIEANDVYLGNSYEHNIPLLFSGNAYTGADYPEPGSSGITSVSTNVIITPVTYHEWRDRNNIATYDSGTGAYIYPP